MLQTQSLSFAYPGATPFSFPDIDCPTGAHTLIIGESGKGKTTLLHLLAGLLSPSSGRISIEGQDIAQMSTAKLDRFRGQTIGIIFQKSHFVQSLSVGDNLGLAQYLAGLKQDPKRVKAVLDRLNIAHKFGQKTQQLSLGEQQRVAIARALINRPSLILADEPTSSLDDSNCKAVLDLLETEAAHVGASLVIVTHDQRLKDRFSKRVEL